MRERFDRCREDEVWKRKVIDGIQNHKDKALCFVTLGTASNPSLTNLKALVTRFQLKLSRRTKAHISSLAAFECKEGHKHAHLILLSDKHISKEDIQKRWKHGVSPDVRFYEPEDSEAIANSAFYVFNHPSVEWFESFCPNPHKCKSLSCPVVRQQVANSSLT